MARRVGSRGREGHHLALTVHGPLGSIDLLVPPGAAATDVAREYAAQAGLGAIPLISTQLGQPLAADLPLVDGGVDSGDVLVASTTLYRPPTDSSAKPRRRGPSAPLTNRGGGRSGRWCWGWRRLWLWLPAGARPSLTRRAGPP